MSVTHFLLLLLCISLHLHACNARRLSTLDKKLKKKTHFSSKNGVRKQLDSSSEQPELRINGDKNLETPPAANAEKTQNRSFKQIRVLKGKASSKSESLVSVSWRVTQNRSFKQIRVLKGKASSKSESLVSVSWRVPRKKPGEKNPGFNLDYSPPKTHPPSHN